MVHLSSGYRLFLDIFSHDKFGQVYDHNVQEGFPVLSALLQKAGELRKAKKLPSDWVDVKGRCEAWLDATHSKAWERIQLFDIEDCDEDGGEKSDGEIRLAVERTRIDDDDFSSFPLRPAWPGLAVASGEGAARHQGGEEYEATLASRCRRMLAIRSINNH